MALPVSFSRFALGGLFFASIAALIAHQAGAQSRAPHPVAHLVSPFAAPTVPPMSKDDPLATALVRDAVNAGRRVSYVGQLSSIRSGSKRAYAVIERVEHRAPDDTRRTYLAPQALYGQYVITRGAMSWDIDQAHKRVVVTENRALDDQIVRHDDIALMAANYRAVRAPDDEVAERKAEVVDLINRYSGERTMRLWVDAKTHVVLGKEEYHGDGSLAWRMRYDAIRFTADIPRQIFTESTPPDFVSVRGRSFAHPSEDLTRAISECGFSPVGPKYLPEGFAVTTAALTDLKGVKNLHLIYSDGIRTMSLFENASDRRVDFGSMQPHTTSFEGHTAQYITDGPTTLLSWRERKLAFTLVGDLDLKDLVKIATSVVP